MSEIIICNQSLSPLALQNQCNIDTDQIFGFKNSTSTMLSPNTPYLIGADSPQSKNILTQLSPMLTTSDVTNLSLSYGGDNIVALSEVTAGLKDYNIGLMGASTSMYANRIGGFAGSVKEYQAALMNFREAVTAKSASKALAKQKVLQSYHTMQSKFQNELRAVTSQVKSRRGTPLTNVNRGLNIAKSSRNVAKLDITSQVQANNLVKFSKQAKFLGGGLAVIDFTSRVGSIHNSYKVGGEWERDLFIESSSFAVSAMAGSAAISTGGAVLTFLLVATPVGWAGLIIGGIVVAGSAAAISIGTNGLVKDNAGEVYDGIMSWVTP